MTGYKEALNWFFQWERSQIAGTDLEQRLQEIFNPAISDADRERLLNTLTEEHAGSPILPELLFQIGAWYRRHGSPQSGLKYLDQAIERYAASSDLHHMNSLHWLYGCILWQIGSNLEACLHWRLSIRVWKEYLPAFHNRQQTTNQEIENARLAYLRCIEREEWHRKRDLLPGANHSQHRGQIAQYQQKAQQWQTKIAELKRTKQGLTSKLEWYEKRLEEMEIALLCTPEEAYLLIKDMTNQDRNRLSQGFVNHREKIEKLVGEHNSAEATKEVERMLAVAPAWTPVEKAESYLVGGWAFYEIKHDGWEKQLKKAVFLYPPDSLGRVWARWLLGAIQWGIPEKVGDAATNWTIAIQDLEHLEKKAEWQNQDIQVEYYSDKISIMHRALEDRRSQLPVVQQAGP